MNALERYIQEGYKDAMNYTQFRGLIDELLLQNKVTGDQQLPELVPYTAMNNQRMNRIEKNYQPGEAISKVMHSINDSYTLLTITEGWCGDSSQIVPVIEKLAALRPNFQSLYILRDANPDIMDQLLTQGTRSIPITVCVENKTGQIKWKYGPRPQLAAEIVAEAKAAGKSKEEMSEELHLWYGRNRQQAIENELLERFSQLN